MTIRFSKPDRGNREVKAVMEPMKTDLIAQRKKVNSRKFPAITKLNSKQPLDNGTTAIHLALASLSVRWRKGADTTPDSDSDEILDAIE